MKFMKRHKVVLIMSLLLIIVVLCLFIAKSFFLSNDSKAIYGSRLEGIEKVKITNDTEEKVKEVLQDTASKVEVRLAGRIIYIDVVVKDDISLEVAKDSGNKTLECFTDVEKSYYDIQVMMKSNTNTAQFPIIGYKHHTRSGFSWTQDRMAS